MIRKTMFLMMLLAGLHHNAPQTGKIRVLIWSEQTEPETVYPQGINGALAEYLRTKSNMKVSIASINSKNFGFSQSMLAKTDVLIWFGHEKHEEIPDKIAAQIVNCVKNEGMGFIALHSAHFSKPFKQLLNTSGAWKEYQEDNGPEKVHVLIPRHPIAKGIQDFTIPKTEMYAEPFQVPKPDAVVMEGCWPTTHNCSREVMTWDVGKGRIVYIRAGHETYPIYFMPVMQKLIANAVRWTAHRKN